MSSQSNPNIPSDLFTSESERNRLLNAVGKTQNEAERRQIRENYRKLQDELIEEKQEIINPSDEQNRLQQKLKIADKVFANVEQPREGSLDSTSLVQIADLGMKKAQALQTDFIHFIPTDFCEKVKILIAAEADLTNQSPFTHNDWLRLTAAVHPLFKKTPNLHFMCGSFDREVSVKKRTQKSKEEKILEKTSGKATLPTQLSKFETIEGGELTTKYVEHVLNTLWNVYEQLENQPVDFFEFVTHPTEFGQTIENIFYTSFLIRDGHARLSLDDEGLPVIEPIQKDESGSNQESSERQQMVLKLTPAEWRQIVQTFDIEEPLIKGLAPDQMDVDSSQNE